MSVSYCYALRSGGIKKVKTPIFPKIPITPILPINPLPFSPTKIVK